MCNNAGMSMLAVLSLISLLPSFSFAQKSVCQMDIGRSAREFSADQLFFISAMCNHFNPRVVERYGKPATVSFQYSLGDNAFFDYLDANSPDILLNTGLNRSSDAQLAFTFCHELGHGIAGGQQIKLTRKDYFSHHFRGLTEASFQQALKQPDAFSEGEADYFAVACMKELVKFEILKVDTLAINSSDVRVACVHAIDPSECEMILSASKASLFASDNPAHYQTRVKLRFKPVITHPVDGCRLKTLKASYFDRKKPSCWRGLFH